MYQGGIELLIEQGANASAAEVIARLLGAIFIVFVCTEMSRDRGTWELPTPADQKVVEGTISQTRARTKRMTSLLIRLPNGTDFEFGCTPNSRYANCPDFGFEELRGLPAKLTYFDVANNETSRLNHIALELIVDGKAVLERSERMAKVKFVHGRQRASDARWPLFATIGWIWAAALVLPTIVGKAKLLFVARRATTSD